MISNRIKQKEVYLESLQIFLEYQEIRAGECTARGFAAKRNVETHTGTVPGDHSFAACFIIQNPPNGVGTSQVHVYTNSKKNNPFSSPVCNNNSRKYWKNINTLSLEKHRDHIGSPIILSMEK